MQGIFTYGRHQYAVEVVFRESSLMVMELLGSSVRVSTGLDWTIDERFLGR